MKRKNLESPQRYYPRGMNLVRNNNKLRINKIQP